MGKKDSLIAVPVHNGDVVQLRASNIASMSKSLRMRPEETMDLMAAFVGYLDSRDWNLFFRFVCDKLESGLTAHEILAQIKSDAKEMKKHAVSSKILFAYGLRGLQGFRR